MNLQNDRTPFQKKNKVLHVSYAIYPGGGPHGYLYNLQEGYYKLVPRINEPNVVFQFWGGSYDEIRKSPAKINVSRIKGIIKRITPAFLQNKWSIRKLQNTFDEWNENKSLEEAIDTSDIVTFHSPIFCEVAKSAKKKGKKVVYMQHSPTPWVDEVLLGYGKDENVKNEFANFIESVERSLFQDADYVILPSEHAFDGYVARYANLINDIRRKAIYIPSGVSEPKVKLSRELIRKELGIPENMLVVIYVGRYHQHKGFDIFLDVIKQTNDPSIKFISMGSGYIKPCQSNNYIDLGWKTNPHDYIAAADIVLSPNRVTYFDLLPLEAMALGKVILTSPVGGNLDLQMYSKGILLAPQNEAHLYLDIIQEIRNSTSFNALGEQNITAYHKYFSLEAFANRYYTRLSKL